MNKRPNRKQHQHSPDRVTTAIRNSGQLLAVWFFDDQGDRAHRIEARAFDTTSLGGTTERFILTDGALLRGPIVLSVADARIIGGAYFAAADVLDGHALQEDD